MNNLKNIKKLCKEFKELDFHYEWEDPCGADGQCIIASLKFNKWLKNKNVTTSLTVFSTRDEVVRSNGVLDMYFGYSNVEVFEFDSPPHHWYINSTWPGHVVSKLDKYFIDWTARQFNPIAPYPLIFSMKLLKETI